MVLPLSAPIVWFGRITISAGLGKRIYYTHILLIGMQSLCKQKITHPTHTLRNACSNDRQLKAENHCKSMLPMIPHIGSGINMMFIILCSYILLVCMHDCDKSGSYHIRKIPQQQAKLKPEAWKHGYH